MSFGHKFTDRCGFIAGVDAKEISPVFTQFLDCVWQLTQQFPTAFQFNERYLLALHDHVYSCQFGTFIGNCEKDRVDLRSVFILIIVIVRCRYHEQLPPVFAKTITVYLLTSVGLITHNISSEAENSFISAILLRHCVRPITTSP